MNRNAPEVHLIQEKKKKKRTIFATLDKGRPGLLAPTRARSNAKHPKTRRTSQKALSVTQIFQFILLKKRRVSRLSVPHFVTYPLMVHVVGEHPAPDPDGPQELVDIVTRVARHSTEDYKNVIHVKRLRHSGTGTATENAPAKEGAGGGGRGVL